MQDLEATLRHGRSYLLLDGYDELQGEAADSFTKALYKFLDRYPKNAFYKGRRDRRGDHPVRPSYTFGFDIDTIDRSREKHSDAICLLEKDDLPCKRMYLRLQGFLQEME